MDRFCRHCGAARRDGNSFCPACGQQFLDARAPEAKPAAASTTVPVHQSASEFTIGHDLSGQPVVVKREWLDRGVYVPGKKGTGKTTLLRLLIRFILKLDASLCIFDPQGDLEEQVLPDIVAAGQTNRVTYLSLTHANFGVNIYACDNPSDPAAVTQTMMFARDVFRKLWGDLFATPQLSETIDFVSLTLIGNPGRTMADIPALLAGGREGSAFREPLIRQAAHTLPPQTVALVTKFWSQYSRTYGESMLNRVSTFLASPVGYTIVSQPHSTVNFRREMDQGGIVYVRLESSLSDLNMLIGSALIGQILNAALSRADITESERKPFYLIAEEYENYQTMAFAEIIDQCRKYKIIPVISHQRFGQLRRIDD